MRMLQLTMFWLLVCALVAAPLSGAATGSYRNIYVRDQCNFTRYPGLCVDIMTGLGSANQQLDDINTVSALVNKTILETKFPTSYFTKFSSNLEVEEAQHVNSITGYCQELLSMSLKRLEQSLLALQNSQHRNKHDIQTWISAAMTYQQACKDSANGHNVSKSNTNNYLMRQISQKMDYLSQLASNTLAIVNKMTATGASTSTSTRAAAAASKLTHRHSSTARHLSGYDEEEHVNFPSWVSRKDRKLLGVQAPPIKANAIVAKDGSGNYKTISEAINAAAASGSGGRFVIYVKAGVYKEKIHARKDGITLIGDGKYSTIISGHDSVNGGSSMPGSATFSVTGDGFIARDMGFENTAGPQGEQALAVYVASDHSVFYRCSIAGYQDTLYAVALRQFYRECDIYGTIDFIFGNAAAVFQSCTLALRRPGGGGGGGRYNVMVANGRSDPGQNTGFSIQNCRIVPSSDFSAVKHSFISYLGRPWKEYSRAVVMESTIDDAIASRGWVEWPGAQGYSKSLYFAEYANTGGGAATSTRVTWPGFHLIGPLDAAKFTVDNFIAGTSWLPPTGVAFLSGLLHS